MRKYFLLVMLLAVLLCGCSESATSQSGEEMMVLQEANVYTMFDDTPVDYYTMGMMEQDYYCIDKKGIPVEILMVDEPKGPEGIRNNGLCFDELSDTAKAAIGAYYDEQGLLYDVEFEVENAYAEYERRKNNFRLFNWHYISQTVWPTGATEEVIGFCTEVILYRGEEDVRQIWYNVIFDRESGEQVDIWQLFSADEAAAKQVILDALMPEELADGEEELRMQMDAAFEGGFIKLYSDGIEVMFPAGALECKEKAFGGFIEAEKLTAVMNIW